MLFEDELQVLKYELDQVQREGPESRNQQIERTFLLDTVTKKENTLCKRAREKIHKSVIKK